MSHFWLTLGKAVQKEERKWDGSTCSISTPTPTVLWASWRRQEHAKPSRGSTPIGPDTEPTRESLAALSLDRPPSRRR